MPPHAPFLFSNSVVTWVIIFIHCFGELQPQGDGRPELQLGLQDFYIFVPSVLLSLFAHCCLPSFCYFLPSSGTSSISIFLFPSESVRTLQSLCSHPKVFEHSRLSPTFSFAALNSTCFSRSPGTDFVLVGECY